MRYTMKIIGIYDSLTQKVVAKQVAELVKLGYPAETLDFNSASQQYGAKYAPSFAILKNDKLGYSLNGKQNFTRVLQWVQDSGI